MTWIRRWSSSLTMIETFSWLGDGDPSGPFGVLQLPEMSWRSTRKRRSSLLRPLTSRKLEVLDLPSAPWTTDSISVFSSRLARLMNGKSARFRASRIREHMTMSLSGPVPRSHSPEVASGRPGSCVGASLVRSMSRSRAASS